jgi:hypothetical protein
LVPSNRNALLACIATIGFKADATAFEPLSRGAFDPVWVVPLSKRTIEVAEAGPNNTKVPKAINKNRVIFW